MEEFKKVEGPVAMINGVDSPSLLSVDSTEPIPTEIDEIAKPGDETVVGVTTPKPAAPVVKESEVKPVEKKEDVTPSPEKKVDGAVKKEDELVKKTDEEPKKPTGEVTPPVKANKKSAEERIGEITKKYRTVERERDFERTKRLEAEAKNKELSAKIPAEDKPQKEDFDSEDEYIEALIDWKTDAKLRVSQVDVATSTKDEDERKASEKAEDELDAAVERGRKKFANFNDLVFADELVLPTEMAELALLSERPEDVLYYLASHPDESAEIAMLPPAKAAIRIGKIEASLEVPVTLETKPEEKPEDKSENKDKPSVKKQTNAPEPIVPVRTDGVVEKDPSKMNPKEYRAWRESA